jgi:hypothetical protein
MAANADLVIVHSRWSERFVTEQFRPRGRVMVMPLGNFEGLYSYGRSSAEVRASFGLSSHLPVCGVIGGVRPYRGHEVAIDATRRLNWRVQLLIAGNALDVRYAERLVEMASGSPHITIQQRGMTDAEYADAVRACDIILLPYEEITGSAALLAAWTLARPTITSNLPFFREFAPSNQAAGLVMPDNRPSTLADSIRQLISVPEAERNSAARVEADKYAWEEVIRPVAEWLGTWQGAHASSKQMV